MCRLVEKIAMAERAEGQIEKQVDNLRKAMDKASYSLDEAMDFFDIPESEREMYRKLLAQ